MASLPAAVANTDAVVQSLPLQNTPLWCLSRGQATTNSGSTLVIVAIVGGSGSGESKTGVGVDQLGVCSIDPTTGALTKRCSLELNYFPDSVFLSPDCRFAVVTTFNTCRAYFLAGPDGEWNAISPAGDAVLTEDEVSLHSDLKRCKVAFQPSANATYDFVTAAGGGAVRLWSIAPDQSSGYRVVPRKGASGEFLNAAHAEVQNDLFEIGRLKRRLKEGPQGGLTAQWTKMLVQEATLRNTGEEAQADSLKSTIDGLKAEIDGITARVQEIEGRGGANSVIADVAASRNGLVAVVREHGAVEVCVAQTGELLFSQQVLPSP